MLRMPRLDELKTTSVTAAVVAACLGACWGLLGAETASASDDLKVSPESTATEGALLAPPAEETLRLNGSVSQPTVDALVEALRQLEDDEDRIGESRRLRLWVARSHLPRWELGAVEHDDPLADEEVEDIVGHCVLKLLRVRLEEHLGLADLKARRDARRHGTSETAALESPFAPRSWSLSPRAGVGHDPWLGGKLRWRRRGPARHLRDGALVLGFKSYLEHDETSALLEWRTDDLSLGLEHVWDSPESGDVTWLSLRWRI